MLEIKPPQLPSKNDGRKRLFLAGSIEMGTAEDWQAKMARDLADLDIVILNPRRDAWDNSWKQSIENPQFYKQVNWELDMLESADLIAMHLDPATKSPISLLELGLSATSGKVIVFCPDGFWRKGNVEIVCARHSIPLAENYGGFLRLVREKLDKTFNML